MRLTSRAPRPVLVATSALFLFGIALAFTEPVRALSQYEPINLQVDTVIAGDPVACAVEVSGAPATITISSDPPGAVSFQGTVTSTTQTVMAQTDANTPAGDITVYLQTEGGTQTVSAGANVAEPEVPTDPPLRSPAQSPAE